MIEAPDFLPLGSIVSLKGNDKKLMIIGRGIVVRNSKGKRFYDYALVPYPQGFIGTAAIYTHANQISAVHHEGFLDAEDDDWMAQVLEAMESSSVERANPSTIGMEW